jgi:endonuclease/exonuclease/phosphatase (EEP) superfamily protein YafD
MVHLGNQRFRLVMTHLSSPVPGDPAATAIQVAQAHQLLDGLRNSAVPVILAGDFNSDAILGTAGPGPDNTPTAALIQSAGFLDSWAAAGSGTGPTWPFFLEDQYPPTFFIPSTPYERIDLIFSQGLQVVSAEQVVAAGPIANQWPSFGSDHAGILATFQF